MTQTLPDATTAATTGVHRPYSDYKQSEFPAVPRIPAHWHTLAFRRVAQLVGDRNDDGQERVMLSLSAYRGVEVKVYDSEELVRPNSESTDYWVVRPHDLVVNPMWVIFGAAGVSSLHGIVSPAYRVYHLAQKHIIPSFAEYLFKCSNYISEYNRHIRGTTTYDRSVRKEDFHQIPVILPPLNEQRAIAAYLDRETVRIDALVAKKQRLIELLREKRAALISHAVTRGLDPNAPLRDSGVSWRGQIPAGWEVKRLKYLAAEPLTYGASEAAESNDISQPRFIRITDISEDGSLRAETFRSLPEGIAKPYLLKHGDILFARSGATVGKTVIYDESWGRACYAGYLIRFRARTSIFLPKFAAYFTRSALYWAWITSTTIQATIQNVSAEKYSNLEIAVPPLKEQHAIVAYLDRETANLDALESAIERQIEKLKEYRAAVIAAAVTGQIDVRGEPA